MPEVNIPPDDCHAHALDNPGEVQFWRRAEITPGQLYQLKRDLAEARAEIERLKTLLSPAPK